MTPLTPLPQPEALSTIQKCEPHSRRVRFPGYFLTQAKINTIAIKKEKPVYILSFIYMPSRLSALCRSCRRGIGREHPHRGGRLWG